MKTFETVEQFLAHVQGMEHRERIVLELNDAAKQSQPQYAWALEVYVTWLVEKQTIHDPDPYNVLFQVVTCDGKHRKGMAKINKKRNYLSTKGGTLAKAFSLIKKGLS